MYRNRSVAPSSAADTPRLADRLLWLCVLVGILAVTIILVLFGRSWWSAVAIAFLIACPIVVVSVLIAERRLLDPRRTQ